MKERSFFYFFTLSFVVCFVACSSPDEDGCEAAKLFESCEKKAVEFRERKYEELLQDFVSYKFQTRSEPREYIERIDIEAEVQTERQFDAAQKNYERLQRKYARNRRKAQEFEEAFSTYRNAHGVSNDKLESLQEMLNKRIALIVPQLPDEAQLKYDLVGRQITDQPDGYHKKGWVWVFQEGEIKELEITRRKKLKEEYKVTARVIFQASGGAQEALIDVTYVLKDGDDWRIDFIESRSLKMVRTGKYDKCVTVEKRWEGFLNIGGYVLDFTNHCDVALVVGGSLYSDSGWTRFSVVIEGSGHATIGGGLQSYIKDYKVDFIERP